jgi:hypothetical protein
MRGLKGLTCDEQESGPHNHCARYRHALILGRIEKGIGAEVWEGPKQTARVSSQRLNRYLSRHIAQASLSSRRVLLVNQRVGDSNGLNSNSPPTFVS